jgi:glycine cleavage system H protein
MPNFLETTIDKFIFKVATLRAYSVEGIWVLEEEGGKRVRLGVSDYQQQLNGDVAFVHLKPAGTALRPGDEFAEVETIKANSSLLSPVSGRIVEINANLTRTPELVNQDPYGQGWLAVVELAEGSVDRAALLNPDAYLVAMRKQAEEELTP